GSQLAPKREGHDSIAVAKSPSEPIVQAGSGADAPARASACEAVVADLDPGGGRLGGNQLKLPSLTVIWEQGLATAERDRLDHQDELVQQLGCEQRSHDRQAAIDVDVAAWLVTQGCHLSQEVSSADQF